MKSRFEANSLCSNNWLRLHGYAMGRFVGKRKHMSMAEYARLPFGKCPAKGRRFRKRLDKKLN